MDNYHCNDQDMLWYLLHVYDGMMEKRSVSTSLTVSVENTAKRYTKHEDTF